MAFDAGAISGSMELDNSKWVAAIGQAKASSKGLETAGENVSKSWYQTFRSGEKSVVSFIRSFSRIGWIAGATFGAMAGFVVNASNELKKMDEAAAHLGMTTDEVAHKYYNFSGSMEKSRAGINMVNALLEGTKNNAMAVGTGLGFYWAALAAGISSLWSQLGSNKKTPTDIMVEWAKAGNSSAGERIKAAEDVLDATNKISQSSTQFEIGQLKLQVEAWKRAGANKTEEGKKFVDTVNSYYDTMSQKIMAKQMVANNNFLIRIRESQGDQMGALNLKQSNELINFNTSNPGTDSRTSTQRAQLVEQQAVEYKQAQQSMTNETILQNANRLKVEGQTTAALALEQQVALDDYVKKWGADSEQTQAFKAGQEEMLAQSKSWILQMKAEFKPMEQFTKETFNSMADGFSNLFYDVVTGQFSSLKQVVVDFGTSILKTLADIAAQWVAMKIFMGIGSSIAGTFGGAAGRLGSGWSVNTNAMGGASAGSFSNTAPASTPSFDVGTDYVPYDMLAQIHQGERIVPAEENRGGGNGSIVLTIHNAITPEAIASGMMSREGVDTIINVINADSLRNGVIRREVIRR